MLPTFADLYAMAFSWDSGGEFQSVQYLLEQADIPKSLSIADAGAGTGRFVFPAVACGYQVCAVEPDPNMFRCLQQTILGLDAALRERVIIVNSSFETFDPVQRFSAVIAMTDTLSYVLPETQLNEFLQQVYDCLEPGGVFVLDVGLWSGYSGESRAEQWACMSGAWQITASYTATVAEGGERGRLSRKVETLTFEGSRPGQLVERSQQRETAAFSTAYLFETLSKAGFVYKSAVEPGALTPIELDSHFVKRAFLSFARPS